MITRMEPHTVLEKEKENDPRLAGFARGEEVSMLTWGESDESDPRFQDEDIGDTKGDSDDREETLSVESTSDTINKLFAAQPASKALRLFHLASWSIDIHPWLQNESSKEQRVVLIWTLEKAIGDSGPAVPIVWTNHYGSLSRHSRWLRLVYRLPCVDSPQAAAIGRIWDSRVDHTEGLDSVARYLGPADDLEDISDWELENVAEALDEAKVPSPPGNNGFYSEKLNYVHLRKLIKLLCSKIDGWDGYEDFKHKYSFVSLSRREQDFRQCTPGEGLDYWIKEACKEEVLGMCRLLGKLQEEEEIELDEGRKRLGLVLRGV